MTDAEQLCCAGSFTAVIAVHVRGRCVPWLAAVDDDHRPPLASELEGGGQAGSRPADDRDVAVPLDEMGCVMAHASRIARTGDFSMSLC